MEQDGLSKAVDEIKKHMTLVKMLHMGSLLHQFVTAKPN
jgi:hypothetical protein